MKRWLILIVFVIGVFVAAPAQILPALVRAGGVDLSAFAISGSLWQGKVQGMVVKTSETSLFIDDVAWQLKPMSLLLGNVCLTLKLDYQKLPLSSDFCYSITGDISLDNFKASSEVAPLLEILGFPFPISGSATLLVDHAQWNQSEGFVAMKGQALAKDYAYHVANEFIVLGDYNIRLGHEAGKLVLDFTPSQALINLDGKVLVDPLGSYYAQLSFIPSPDASAALVNSLQFIAARQSDGSFKLDYKGTF
jgi:hypothetical protein